MRIDPLLMKSLRSNFGTHAKRSCSFRYLVICCFAGEDTIVVYFELSAVILAGTFLAIILDKTLHLF